MACNVIGMNQALLNRGLSLGTFGSNNGQTIAGAISTGAHGANRALPIVISQRFVKCTDALLGYTRHGAADGANHPFPRATCILEIDGVGTPEVQQFLDESLCILADNGIRFSLHWGKNLSYFTQSSRDHAARCQESVGHSVPRNTIEDVYGSDLNLWREKRDELLTPDALRLFTNPVLERMGVLP